MDIYEYLKDGYEHSEVNSAVVALCLTAYPEEDINFYCGQKHFEIVSQLLSQHNINISRLKHREIIPLGKSAREYSNCRFYLNLVKKAFTNAKNNNANKILFLYTKMYLIYFLKVFCIFNKNIKVACAIHSELEEINPKEYAQKSLSNNLQAYIYATVFGIQNPLKIFNTNNLKYIVFAKSIEQNTLKLIPTIKSNIVSLPHPYLYNECPKHEDNEMVNIGIIGLSSKDKNSGYILKLLKSLEKLPNKFFKFHFAGQIKDQELLNYAKTLDFVCKDSLSATMISSERRNEIINKLDYALFTYNLNSYKYTASGAFMDSINYEKPTISISTDYIKNYFDTYGNIGYLSGSYDEFEKRVFDIINNFPKQDYIEQVKNIQIIKQSEKIQNLAKFIKNAF